MISPDGTVVSSSQQTSEAWRGGHSMFPMMGIILSVEPCDAKGNLCADNSTVNRGPRHECTVLATDTFGTPDTVVPKVIVPPPHHSGIDNYSEDLPRGCSKDLIDGKQYDLDFIDVDTSKLDGEWCLVGFVGGKIDHPFLMGWWPHPHNNFDPATTGRAYDGKSLKQVDLAKNRFRKLCRLNGTEWVVSPDGSVYLDTQQAGRKVKVAGTQPEAAQIDKGGHLQVDVKAKAQFELNWNDKPVDGPKIGAGSTSAAQVHDPALPHQDQPLDTETPPARETTKTYIRGKAYELLMKTSNFSIFCEDSAGEPGDYIVMANNGVTISQQPADGSKSAAVVNISDGGVTIQAQDGSIVSVTDDQIVLLNKNGSQVSLVGSSILISAAGGVSIPVPVAMSSSVALGAGVAPGIPPTEPAVLGGLLGAAFTAYNTAVQAIVPNPSPDGGAAVAVQLKTATATLSAAVVAAISSQVTVGA